MDFLLFLLFLGACFAAGSTGALFPTGPWYEKLNKPVLHPTQLALPGHVDDDLRPYRPSPPPASPPLEGSAYAMAFWAAQIAFNAVWTPVFFGLRNMKGFPSRSWPASGYRCWAPP